MTATMLDAQRNDRPYLILGGMQVLDIVSTWVILTYWSVRAEGNPVAAWVLSLGVTQGLAVLLVFKLVVVWLLWRKQSKVRLLQFVYGAVLLNNGIFLGLWLTSVLSHVHF